jgi:hypothetical protein
MATPDISDTTSILGLIKGRQFIFAPTGTDLPKSDVTLDAATNRFTFTDSTPHLVDGDRVRLLSVTTGAEYPATLSPDAEYFIVSLSGSTFQLSLTSGGAAIAFSTNGVGSFYVVRADTWSADNLPDGMTIATHTGSITGAPTETGVFVANLRAQNDDGQSANHQIVIGVETNRFLDDASVEFDFNLATGQVRTAGQNVGGRAATSEDGSNNASSGSSTAVNIFTGADQVASGPLGGSQDSTAALASTSETQVPPVLHLKRGDSLIMALGFVKNNELVDLPVATIRVGLREFEPDKPLFMLNDGSFARVGDYDTTRFQTVLRLDENQVPGLSAVLSNYEDDVATYFDAPAEIEVDINWLNPATQQLEGIVRTSRTFLIRVHRDVVRND